MATITSPPEPRVVLHDISWETYERLLADQIDRSAPRFTFDRGELEILGPSAEHEIINRTLALLVELIAAEWAMDVLNVGSMTFKRADLQRGFEPDTSFYIANESSVRDRDQIDLTVDPPPDLIIEIDMSSSALPKRPIFAAMGVPEVWRWDGERVTILRLVAGEYRSELASTMLALLTSEILTRFLAESRVLRRTAWVRQIRERARAAS